MNFENSWKRVDSLIAQEMPESAAKIVQEILSYAQKEKNRQEIIKAKVWLLALKESRKDESDTTIIQRIEKELASTKDPIEQAIWHNRLAAALLRYFEEHRYEMYNRTPLAASEEADMDSWDASRFHQEIQKHYLASIANRNILENASIDAYKSIIEPGKNSYHLRPSLYDILVFDALSYFENDERNVVQPAYAFTLNDANFFTEAKQFTQMNIATKDSSSLHWQALRLYQYILQKYIDNNQIDALVDADMHRLAFVHTYATLSNKKALYTQALMRLVQKYPNSPEAATAWYKALANKRDLIANEETDFLPEGTMLDNGALDWRSVVAELKALMRKYPKTTGAQHAAALLADIERPSIGLELEEAYLPNENIKALIRYANIDKVKLNLYRSTVQTSHMPLREQQLIKTWEQALPNSQDYRAHSVEVKVEPLPIGTYILEIANKEKSLSTSVLLQVSNLTVLSSLDYTADAHQNIALHRADGSIVRSPKLALLVKNKERPDSLPAKVAQMLHGDVNGQLPTLPEKLNLPIYQIIPVIISGQDSFILEQHHSYTFKKFDRKTKEVKERNTVFIFTDRSIYRPGQTVYFKAIMLKGQANTPHSVASKQKLKVSVKDGNYQTVKEFELLTNEFGSVAGSFETPTSGFGGNMTITTEYGNTHISVEEYKRPKFQVLLDTLKTQFELGDNITVSGKAQAYAGNVLDAAKVQYRVYRTARFPYPWLLRIINPHAQRMEIAQGSTQTNADGSFSFDFKALADESIDASKLPVFNFTITVDITDINGETQSSTKNIAIGYRSLDVQIIAPEQTTVAGINKISIQTKNLSGIFQPAAVSLRIVALENPDKLYRKRLWSQPTDFLYSKEEFQNTFPHDEYKDEWTLENRRPIAVVWTHQYQTQADSDISIPDSIWMQSGYYLIEAQSLDHKNREVIQKQYVYVYVPQYGPSPDMPLFVGADKTHYQPGDSMWLQLRSIPAHPQIWKSKLIDVPLKANQLYQLGLREQHRGGLFVKMAAIHNNRSYENSQNFVIPWSNKDLNITWGSHRSKLEPGAEEEWTLTIKGHKKELLAAELLAGMYDASLDALKPHQWTWSMLVPKTEQAPHISFMGLRSKSNEDQGTYMPSDNKWERTYPYLNLPIRIYESINYNTRVYALESASPAPMAADKANMRFKAPTLAADAEMASEAGQEQQEIDKATSRPANQNQPWRTDFKETAFFIPDMQTDKDGNIKLKFKMPESLTEWRFMAFAHTTDWKTGYLEGRILSQKKLMVTPNLPRFFRQGDSITILTKISNLSDTTLQGKLHLELLDPATMQAVHLPFGIKDLQKPFTVAAGQNTAVDFALSVPLSRFEPVLIRLSALTEQYSDGEEHLIPVLSNRSLVTETLPLWISGNTTQEFTLENLLHASGSKSLLHKGITVEFTSNPAWYAIQALPYLIDFPHECAEQTFNRFYATALAAHITAQHPKIAAVFKQWQKEDSKSLQSKLQSNQELKSALLEETPWVLEAQSETEQMQAIAYLFDAYKLSDQFTDIMNKLQQMQNPDGSFPWFAGMRGNVYITQYIITGMAKLQALDVAYAKSGWVRDIMQKGLNYLDREMLRMYKQIKPEHLQQNNLNSQGIYYLYMHSMANRKQKISAELSKVIDYYMQQEQQFWTQRSPMLQGMIALTQHRAGNKSTALQIMSSLTERAVHHKEMGTYWPLHNRFSWTEYPIETQSLLITAYNEILDEQEMVSKMKVWLLKQKQTQSWPSTTATADAIYALLSTGADWLQAQPSVQIQLGSRTISSQQQLQQAGTGYFKTSIPGKEVSPDMARVRVQIQNSDVPTAWGSVYWQYFEDIDKIPSARNEGFSIEKQIYLVANTDRGPVLQALNAGSSLHVGDKVKVRLVIRADRAMDYVHVKDMRASGLEPTNVLSGYRWASGAGYYESTKDLASHFFFDHLPKGTLVLEYELVANQSGKFATGLASIQCMYAPEFSAHSAGSSIQIQQ